MDLLFFLRGLLIGFSIAAPVGPIGVLCIRRTLTEGSRSGFISGLGAATADSLYGCIAGFGLTFVSDLLMDQRTWLRLVGGAFLCYLGIKTFFTRPAEEVLPKKGKNLVGTYASTFFLTLTNPMTILSFMAIFAGLGVGSVRGHYLSSGLLVLGVFSGSGCWWLILSAGVGILGKKFHLSSMWWVNRVSGIVISAFGILAFCSFGE